MMATMPAAFPLLFSPVSIGGLSLANRVVMAAMETNLAGAEGEVTPALLAHYRRRAAGGAGMVIVEYTAVERRHGLGSRVQLSLDRDDLVDGHARLADAIRSGGARACLQLHHAGRQTSPRFLDGRRPVAPSVVDSWLFRHPPRALEAGEIEALVGAFAAAAARAAAAGYDAVELHGAHGYLLGQFLSPWSNRRDDAWGGDPARRLAFPVAVVRAVKAALGGRALVYRMSAEEFVPGGLDPAEAAAAARALVAAGADAIHVATGVAERLDTNVDPIAAPEGWRLGHARRVRQALAGAAPVVAVGVIRRPDLAEAAIAEGSADLVALGRALLADPDWPLKAAAGEVAAIRPCTSCNWCIQRLMRHGPVGCAENPAVGREHEPAPRARPDRPVAVVVGGGPGGMAGALMLADAGCRVVLFEAARRLGGGLVVSAAPPFKDKLLWYRDHLERRVAASAIEVRLATRADPALILALDPAFVLLATGGRERAHGLAGRTAPIAVAAYDVLAGRVALGPGPVVVWGGGETGCEAAEFALAAGHAVTLVTRQTRKTLAPSAEPVYRRTLLARLLAAPGLTLRAEATVTAIGSGVVTVVDAAGTATLPAGQVLLAQGRVPEDRLAALLDDALDGGSRTVARIGDARRPGRIGEAVNDAWDAVRAFLDRAP